MKSVKGVILLNFSFNISFLYMVCLINYSWIMVQALEAMKLDIFVINIVLKEKSLHLIINKVMVNPKPLTNS